MAYSLTEEGNDSFFKQWSSFLRLGSFTECVEF